jgi:hypothetical protein
MCSKDNGSCLLILKLDRTIDMEGHFTILVTKVPGRWNGGISRKEKCQSASGARCQVITMDYIEGKAKIKRRLASEPREASVWSFPVLEVSATHRGGRQLMKIKQVAETSAQSMNVRNGGSSGQSAQDLPVCRFS